MPRKQGERDTQGDGPKHSMPAMTVQLTPTRATSSYRSRFAVKSHWSSDGAAHSTNAAGLERLEIRGSGRRGVRERTNLS